MGVRIEYAVQEELLGTGHALQSAEPLAEKHFLVLNGDILPDVAALEDMLRAGGPAVAARQVEDPRRYGVFLTDPDDRGLMRSVVEKSPSPPSNLANAGIYLLGREVFPALEEAPLSSRGEYELTDALNVLAGRRSIRIVELGEWTEVGRPWDLLEANRSALQRRGAAVLGDVEAGATLTGQVCIGQGTVVRAGAYIQGPVVIGRNCDIGPNCYIRSGTCIGDEVRIGNAVEVKNSTVMDGTKIGHLSYLGDSVIGCRCNFGAGTIVSNLRHDDASIKSYARGELVDSGRRKLGVIMGDGVKTGIHTTIYPGTVIEPGYRSRPGEILRGHVPPTGKAS
ncbi:MAG: glucose-1-phosphate thymidylyltransferase [Methanosarcinales archaeon]|nr:glucose-1-phosphate thymidylyltransferase [Methanosarcinales archaeon]